MQDLIAAVKPLSSITPTAGLAAATGITGSIIDSDNFGGVLFIVQFGTIVAGAATSFKVEHSSAADMTGNADVLGTSQTVTDTDSNKVFYVDVVKPSKRYLRLLVSRATQNATVSSTALVYGPRDAPFAQTATGETHFAPISGTA